MRIITLSASVSRKAGGFFNSVRCLSKSLAELPETQVSVLGLHDEHTVADNKAWAPLVPEAFCVCGPAAFGFSPALKEHLLRKGGDLLHQHGIWQYISVAAHKWHRQNRRPHVISPRGMLDPWALNNSRWKKRLAGWLSEDAHLRHAACLHALCESEAQSIRAYGLKNPVCIIPNGIDPPEMQNAECRMQNPPWEGHIEPGRKVLLYLGRIHPKKGLVNLLRAWAAVQKSEVRGQRSEWTLVIAGWDQGGHEKELRALSAECGMEKSVVFLGPQFEEEKAECYRNCDAFILPSFSEGLPMVVLEAWAYGKPVLITPECHLPEGFAADAAIRILPSADSIARGLEDLFRTPHSALRTLGDNGRQLVASRFAWPRIAADMKAVYDWVLGGGPKPACVITI